MTVSAPAKIEICMGSSCFSRGNNRNIEVIQKHLASSGPSPAHLSGHLCLNQCKAGPNVTVDGRVYHAVDPAVMSTLLRRPAAAPRP